MLTGFGRGLAAHWQFSVVLAVAVALRCVVMLGYRPILWYSDSYNYIADAVDHIPDVMRSSGYPFFLFALLPLHSLTLVAALQALMGVLMGVAIYAVLRRRGLPWWGATLPALPVLFDVFELQVEHMVMSDALFVFLITVAVAALCWFDQPPVTVSVIAGLMIGYAAIVRAVGEPLLAVVVVALLLRRVNWKRVGLLLIAGLVPIVGYMAWYHLSYGQYALDGAGGTFLYSRVSSFAECAKMPNLPQDLKVLCDPRPPDQPPSSQEYLGRTAPPWSGRSPVTTSSPSTPTASRASSPRTPSRPSRWPTPKPCADGPRAHVQLEPCAVRRHRVRAVVPVRDARDPGDQEQHPVVGAALLAGQKRAGALRQPSLGQPTV